MHFSGTITCDSTNGATFSIAPFPGFVGNVFLLDSSNNNEKKTACTLTENNGVYTYTNYPYGDTPDAVNCPVSEETTSPKVSVNFVKLNKLINN